MQRIDKNYSPIWTMLNSNGPRWIQVARKREPYRRYGRNHEIGRSRATARPEPRTDLIFCYYFSQFQDSQASKKHVRLDKGLRMNPNGRLADETGRFRTTHWSVVLLSAQSQVSGSRTALADLCRLKRKKSAGNFCSRIRSSRQCFLFGRKKMQSCG